MTGPAKIGHLASQNLTAFQTFVAHKFLLQYGMATQFSEMCIIQLTFQHILQNPNTIFQY